MVQAEERPLSDPPRAARRTLNSTHRRQRGSLLNANVIRSIAAGAVIAAVASACGGGGGAEEAAGVPSPTVAASPTAAASPTPEALGDPAPEGERALAHVAELTKHGSRVAGSETEILARDYLRSELERYGYDVTVQQFPFDGSDYRPAKIEAGGEAFAAIAFGGSVAGEVTGTLTDAGIGRPEEFPAGGLQGGVALIERGDLTFARKSENAVAAGAGAIIVYNNEEGNLVGDAEGAGVPMVGVQRSVGLDLLQRLAAGPVTATVSVVAPRGTAYNVIAKPKGATSCRTISGGHFDSVPVADGADDNASGTAATLELARAVAASKLAGPHCFALFGAEEFGLIGSRYFVEQMSDAEINGLRAMVNLDVVGTVAPLSLIGSDDMVELARVEAQQAGIEASPGSIPGGSGSDHFSFEEAGVPVIFFYRHDDLIHTPADAIDRISAGSLEETMLTAFGVLEALSGG